MMDLLYVEDDDVFREVQAEALRNAGFEVRQADSAEAALEQVVAKRPDVVLLDLSMPPGKMTGLQFLSWLQGNAVRVPVVIFTGFGDVVNEQVVRSLGAAAVVTKGEVSSVELARVLRMAEDRDARKAG